MPWRVSAPPPPARWPGAQPATLTRPPPPPMSWRSSARSRRCGSPCGPAAGIRAAWLPAARCLATRCFGFRSLPCPRAGYVCAHAHLQRRRNRLLRRLFRRGAPPAAAGVQGGRALTGPRAGPRTGPSPSLPPSLPPSAAVGTQAAVQSLRPGTRQRGGRPAPRPPRRRTAAGRAGGRRTRPRQAAPALRTAAEWLLALASQVTRGQAVLAVPLEDGPLSIPLDPHLPPVEQARAHVPPRRQARRAPRCLSPNAAPSCQEDLALIDQLALDLQSAANQPEIAAVQEELRAAGLLGAPASSPAPSGRQAGKAQAQPARRTARVPAPAPQAGCFASAAARGWRSWWGAMPGRTTRDLCQEAHPDDLWLHARGVPGSHTIIRTGGQAPDEETVRRRLPAGSLPLGRPRRPGGGRDRDAQTLGPACAGRQGRASIRQAGRAGGDGAGRAAGRSDRDGGGRQSRLNWF